MKQRMCLAGLVMLGLASQVLSAGQFSPQEIGQRGQWEEFLLSAEIVRSEPLPQGITKPWKLYLRKGGIERPAAWKNIHQRLSGGSWDDWRYEIAAYRLDKLIGLNAVPPAVERKFGGRTGALSLWVDSKYNLVEITERNIPVPPAALRQYENMGSIYRLWTCLIANDDPTQENMRFTEDWRMFFIDHSRAFRSDKDHIRRLVFGVNGLKKRQTDGQPYIIYRVPRALLGRIKGLGAGVIKQAVGPYLTDKEIQAIVIRVGLIEDEIAAMVKQYGEDKVLY